MSIDEKGSGLECWQKGIREMPRTPRPPAPFHNGLTQAQAERLAVLAEEAAEVVQAVTKVLRHGFESHHPMGGPTNRRLLEKELGDLRFAVQLCIDGGDVDGEAVSAAEVDKGFRVVPFLHHNKYLITGVEEHDGQD